MAEQPRRRESSPRLRPGGPQQPPSPGWRVTPAPDGRGGRPAKPPSGPNIRWIAVILVIALVVLNFWVSSKALSPSPRVHIPYSPTFLQQVEKSPVFSGMVVKEERRSDQPGADKIVLSLTVWYSTT